MTAHDPFRDDLPLYAVGTLPQDEARAIETHLAGCAECREEVRALQEAAAHIALAVDTVAPPADLQRRLMEKVRANSSPAPQKAPARWAQSATSRRRSPWFWIPAFAVIVSAIFLVVMWNRAQDLARQNLDLAEQLQRSEEMLRQNQALTDMLQSADAQRITLVEAGQNPKPEARTIYSPERRSLVLLASHLRPLPADKTYELWLLPASGAAPVPAGTFAPDAQGSASLIVTQFTAAVPAKGFAVTAETKPGSPTPTLPILLSGTS